MPRTKLNLPKYYHVFAGPASPARKAIAFMLDLLLVNLVLFAPFQRVIMKLVPSGSLGELQSYLIDNMDVIIKISYLMLFSGLMLWLYFSILEYKIGTTFGKMLMNINVASTEKNRQMTMIQSMMRNFLLIVMMVPLLPFFLVWVIDILSSLFNANGMRYLERWSRTMVVQRVVM